MESEKEKEVLGSFEEDAHKLLLGLGKKYHLKIVKWSVSVNCLHCNKSSMLDRTYWTNNNKEGYY